ncbi:hypothetical protein Acr_00g0072200 [Actinidia rufa]|uniref:Uncharacterized protein n=1 Tax=Actinidia rufa TaxID=165716 RepID=A0A7J0DRR4_9ERIC|nr:hypothetical protein Acr_00g0072200 [Actinidia rufa]
MSKLSHSCTGVRFTFDVTPALLVQWSLPSYRNLRARRSSVSEIGAVANKGTIRTKAFVTSEVPLNSELGTITVLETWTKDDSHVTPKGCQGIEGYGRVSSLLTDTMISMYRHTQSHNPSRDGTASTLSHALGWNTKEKVAILRETFAKLFPMALHSNNRSDSRETHGEAPHAPKTPGHKGSKLLLKTLSKRLKYGDEKKEPQSPNKKGEEAGNSPKRISVGAWGHAQVTTQEDPQDRCTWQTAQ